MKHQKTKERTEGRNGRKGGMKECMNDHECMNRRIKTSIGTPMGAQKNGWLSATTVGEYQWHSMTVMNEMNEQIDWEILRRWISAGRNAGMSKGLRACVGARARVKEWMRGWVNAWLSEWMSEWVSEWVDDCVGSWVGGRVTEWIKAALMKTWVGKRECPGPWIPSAKAINTCMPRI